MAKTIFLAGATGVIGLPVVHAEAAAHAALLALEQNESGIFNIADDYAELKTDKAKYKLHWDAAFRLN